MADSETIRIGGCDYTVTKLLARDAIRLSTRIGRVVAPFIGKIAGADDLESALADAVGDLFGRPELADDLDYANAALGMMTQVAFTNAQGQAVTKTLDAAFLDGHFRGKLDEWVEWLVFALKVNLSSFFNGSSQIGQKIRAKALAAKAARAEVPSGSLTESARTG